MFLPGDIFLNDYDIFAAKVVKFVMKYPTIWHFLFGRLFGWRPDPVVFYHAGIILNKNAVVEQQWKVRIASVQRQILDKPSIVFRNTKLTEKERNRIAREALKHIGRKYDWVLILGKLFTWLTGFVWLQRWIQLPRREICCSLVAKVYWDAVGETFGKESWHDVTTDDIDDYCRSKGGWRIVYISPSIMAGMVC
ncbi:MAG: hypothetical protein DRG83_00275 [Deltaproteobacteria bacterium]|nr:MAG: hypothetical protein DRG83_00275 [Deltaproteobacteria bacterium]